MDLNLLEQMRIRKILKLFLLFMINTIMMVVTLPFVAAKSNSDILLFIIFIAFFVAYSFIVSIPKNFENKVKKVLLPQLLKNIMKDKGQMNWQGSQFEVDEITSEEKIEDSLEKLINKRCSVVIDLDKFIEYDKEKYALEEKDDLTGAEKQRLKEIKAYLNEEERKFEANAAEKYNIRLALLKEFENKNGMLNKEDSIKVEYLKRENESYEESKELSKLQEKNEDDLTPDEKSRKKYLEQKFNEQDEIFRQEVDKLHSDMDRGLCLFDIFNHSISYDDVFYGNYKGIEFITVEGKEEKVFTGTVIRIPLEKKFNNTLLVLNKALKAIPLQGVTGLQQDLHLIKLQNFDKHSIWAKGPEGLDQIIDDNFIRYVNNLNMKFTYMFKGEFAYLIWPHTKDFFKLGSLFKKVDNQKQYINFEKDINLMLVELERFALSIRKSL